MKPFKCKCGCEVLNGQITALCPRSIAGFQLAELSKRVEGQGIAWENLIMKELQKHAVQVLKESKQKRILTIN